jgi:hypothetical protein
MIQQTSLEAFDVVVRPSLNSRQMVVLGAFQACGDLTDYEGSKYCKIPINSFVPRRYELVKLGHLRYKGVKVNEIGRSVMLWGV